MTPRLMQIDSLQYENISWDGTIKVSGENVHLFV